MKSELLISARFWASFILGAVILIYSQPDSIMRIDCSTVALVSIVFVVVMDWIRIGLRPPSGVSPIKTSRVLYRE